MNATAMPCADRNPQTDIYYNPYDIRIPCADPDGVCYEEVKWITSWMNDPDVKRALGVDHSPIDFVACNKTTNAAFYLQGQAMHNSAALLPKLIKDGIRLLVFAGDTGRFSASQYMSRSTQLIVSHYLQIASAIIS